MDPRAQQALSKVERWQRKGATEMWHGFPIAPGGKPFLTGNGRQGVTSIADLSKMSRTAPTEVIPLDGLVATQPSVKLQDVAEYLKDPDLKDQRGYYGNSGALVDLPLIVRFDGTDYIHDGHHRLTAQRLSGRDEATVRMLDLDDRGRVAWAAGRTG